MSSPRALSSPETELATELATESASEGGYAKSRDTRARILAAAHEEAAESGFYKTSVARIAARAGVAIGSLNYHFGSREALLRELMSRLMDDYMAQVQAVESRADDDYFARERALLLAYVEHIRRSPSYVRLAEEIRFHEPELYRRGARYWIERMTRSIRSGIAEGSLQPMSDAEITLKAHLLMGARHALEELAQNDPNLDGDEVVEAYIDLVHRGLGTPAQETGSPR